MILIIRNRFAERFFNFRLCGFKWNYPIPAFYDLILLYKILALLRIILILSGNAKTKKK